MRLAARGERVIAAAKAALSTLLEGLRIYLDRHGIDLTVLSPGLVRSNEGKKRRPMEVPRDRTHSHDEPPWPGRSATDSAASCLSASPCRR